jgi:hypothetical protein
LDAKQVSAQEKKEYVVEGAASAAEASLEPRLLDSALLIEEEEEREDAIETIQVLNF